MPKVPQYLSSESIRTGPTGPHADPSAFNDAPGFGAVGQGLTNLGGDLSNVAYRAKLVQEKQRRDDEAVWIGNSLNQLDRVLSEFQSDPANLSKDSFAIDFDKFAKDQAAEYQRNAPTPRSASQFKVRAGSEITRRYSAALLTAQRTRLENQVTSFENQTADALLAFRQDLVTPNLDATEILNRKLEGLFADISGRFGTLAPQTAQKLQAHVVTQAILATAKHNPAYAREILESTDVLDEARRATLLNHIEEADRTGKALRQWTVSERLKDSLDFGTRGEAIPLLDPNEVIAAFGPERGSVLVADFQKQAAIYNEGNATVQELGDKNANYAAHELKRRSDAGTITPAAAEIAAKRLDRIADRQRTDPVGFLRTENDEVRTAADLIAGAPSDLVFDYAKRYRDITLAYQGFAPADAEPEEAARYLNLPVHGRHLLSNAEAIQIAQKIKLGAPAARLKELEKIKAQYHQDHFPIVLNDLVKLPPKGDGISPALQFAALNTEHTWVNDFISTSENPEVIKNLNPQKYSEFEEELVTNGTWNEFARAMFGEHWQRGTDVSAWKDALVTYAASLSLKHGSKPSAAVETAVERLISSELGIPSVHGQPLVVMRRRRDGTIREDDEIQDYGRRLAVAMRDLDPREIKLTDETGKSLFPTLPPFKDDDVLKMEHLRTIVTATGFFVAAPDGQSVTLYVQFEDGVLQLRDKNNQPFEIDLDDLPQFISPRTFQVRQHAEIKTDASGRQRTEIIPHREEQRPVKEFPSASYEIETRELLKPELVQPDPKDKPKHRPWMFWKNPRRPVTNWPRTGEFWKHQRKDNQ